MSRQDGASVYGRLIADSVDWIDWRKSSLGVEIFYSRKESYK